MKFLRRIFAKIFNRYEGGQRWSTGNRSWIPSWGNRDARFDADSVTREELVRKSRYFERNNAILNRLADLFEQFTVGPNGLQFIPASDNEAWNERRKAAWDQWCKFCDVSSLHGFGTIQSLAARCWFIDGEVFIQKTYGESKIPGQPAARPRIQIIEAHRVATPPTATDGKNLVDGIELDDRGRPVAYWVRTTAALGQDTTYKRYPADEIIHIFEPSRPGQYRGLPFVYPVLNDLHDLDDLQILEMDAAKDAAQVTNVITNTAGEPSKSNLLRNRMGQTNQTSQGTDIDQNRTNYIKKVFRAQPLFLKRGEGFEQHASQRPSVAVQQYWDYLAWKICAGVGISKLLVFPASIQGTVARGDYDIACAFFGARSAVLAAAFGRIYEWVTEWDVANDRTLADKPGNWKAYTVQTPRKINVDVGRNSAAMLAELEQGATTYAEIYGPLGKDWRQQIRQRFIEESYIDALTKEFPGITPERIRAAIAETFATANQVRVGLSQGTGRPPVYAD